MSKQHGARASQFRHGAAQVAFFDVSEFVNAGGCQETLEPKAAGLEQRNKLASVARHDAAPKSNIPPALACGGSHFRLVGWNGSGRGNAVQRHLDERGDATCRGRARSRLKTL